MITRDDIVAEARSWLGTPFRHQGRIKGVGVDCAGVVIETGRALGLTDYAEEGYSKQPNPYRMGHTLDLYLDRIYMSEAQPGDVYWMRFIEPMHLAIATQLDDGRPGLVHAYADRGKCVEHTLNDKWQRRIVRCYRFRGVE